MASRLTSIIALLGALLLAWLAVTIPAFALGVQLAVAASVLYVAYLAWQGWRVMRVARALAPAAAGEAELPFVTVIVPAKDEAPVIAAVTGDLAAQAYRDADGPRFEVLVVDDGSTDATGPIASGVAAAGSGTVRVVRREPGSGPAMRGAALDFGMAHARGEVVVALDADARVDPDFLARAIHAWQRDPDAAGLQVQRRPMNAERSWLTRAQAEELMLDMASQCGRWAVGGTAELRGNGMFVRRATLERIGGFGRTALTEDLDLSTRLATAGERVTLAPEATVGEEAVEEATALWRQRLRWAEGSLRRLMEHGPGLLLSGIPIGSKLDFISFLAEFIVPPLMVGSAVSALLAGVIGIGASWEVPLVLALAYAFGTFLLALGGLAADGRRGLALLGGAARGALFLSHWLLVIPVALLRIALGPAEPVYVKTPRAGHRTSESA